MCFVLVLGPIFVLKGINRRATVLLRRLWRSTPYGYEPTAAGDDAQGGLLNARLAFQLHLWCLWRLFDGEESGSTPQ